MGKNLAGQLESGTLITRKGEGHTGYFFSNCVQKATDAYLLELHGPEEGPRLQVAPGSSDGAAGPRRPAARQPRSGPTTTSRNEVSTTSIPAMTRATSSGSG